MSAIEQRARACFAEWHRQRGCSEQVIADCLNGQIQMPELAADLLRLALTPPEGFVLVPVYPTEAMLDAEHATAEIHNEWGEDLYVENAEAVWAAMLAARPEMP